MPTATPTNSLTRRALFTGAAASALACHSQAAPSRPNIVLVFADDLGYGDLGCYGSRSIRTPHIDRLASEGVRLTSFCSASPLCSPSRAALLTGRYAPRTGVPRVINPKDTWGLDQSEATIAGLLRPAGYASACIGKWHIGHQPHQLPTSRGFDQYFGIPYSNDMPPSPLIDQDQIIEEPAEPNLLTRRYTERAVKFIKDSRQRPFFLYMPHTYPHLPLGVSPQFRGKSDAGLYGDTVEELDWSVGEIVAELERSQVADNTLVIFTSDNGPAYEGSAGPFRGRKGVTWEGGHRVPFVARFPGHIPHGESLNSFASTLDLMPTFLRLAAAEPPEHPLDGDDIWPLLQGTERDDERLFLYFDDIHLQAARYGRYKLHISRYNSLWTSPPHRKGKRNLPLPQPELYDLELDPSESYDVSTRHPGMVRRIQNLIETEIRTFPEHVLRNYRRTMSLKRNNSPVGSVTWY